MRTLVAAGAVMLTLAGCTSSPEAGSAAGRDPGSPTDTGSSTATVEAPGDVRVLRGHTGPVVELATLADGRLASTSEDGDLRVWDPSSGDADVTIAADLSKVAALVQLHDGRLVTGSPAGAEIWDPDDPTAAPVVIPGSRNTYSLAVLSDGAVAVGDANATVRIWDAADLSDPIVVYDRHSTAGRFGALTYEVVELSSGLIASAAAGEVDVWDRAEPEVTIASSRASQPRGYFTIAELADGSFASASTNGWVYLWDLDRPGSDRLGHPEPGFYTGSDVAVLDDDLVASRGTNVWVWSPSDPSTAVATYERGQATALAVLADGRLAVGYYDGEIHLWDPGTP